MCAPARARTPWTVQWRIANSPSAIAHEPSDEPSHDVSLSALALAQTAKAGADHKTSIAPPPIGAWRRKFGKLAGSAAGNGGASSIIAANRGDGTCGA